MSITAASEPIPEAPRLLDGTELLGQAQGSGLREPPYLVRRADGQVVQLSHVLYLAAAHADGRRDVGEIAEAMTAELDQRVKPEHVTYILERKLHPLGLVPAADGTLPALERVDPLLGLKFRIGVVPPRAVDAVARLLAPLFAAPVVAVVLAAVLALDVWILLHGLDRAITQVMLDPILAPALFAIGVASVAFHEAGHAAACRWSGGRPGAIGVGLYIVWPVFYTDVTDSYRLSRAGRLRTDLGGMYFNVIFVLAVAAVYAGTGFEPLLLVILGQHMLIAQQFSPILRLDGYYVLSDLIGVSDLFARITPVLRSLRHGSEADPRVAQLKPWARRTVIAWVLTTIAAFAAGFALLAWFGPRYVERAWQSFHAHADVLGLALAHGEIAVVLNSAVAVVLLALPVLGLLLTYLFACGRAGSALAGVRSARTALRYATNAASLAAPSATSSSGTASESRA